MFKRNLFNIFVLGLLAFLPASVYAHQQIALTSPSAITNENHSLVIQVNDFGTFSIPGATSGVTYTLLNNPGGYFSIVGTDIVAASNTPAGQYSISIQATGSNFSINKTFVLNFSAIFPPTPHFFVGGNLSGLENIPPSLPPSIVQVSYFVSNNISNFRLPINWINIQPTINTALNPTFVASLHTALANIHAAGGVATIDLHNFGNCPGQINVGTPSCPISAFVDVWTRIVTEFGSDAGLYGIDLMNEWFNGFPFQTLFDAQQQAITAIRGLGYTGFIYAEGTAFTGTWNWVTGQGNPYNNNLLWQLVDPLNKLKLEGHMYYDRNNSGTNFSYAIESAAPGEAPPGISTNPTIGVTRLAPWIQWGAQNNVTLNYGEGGVSSDAYGLGGNLNFTAWNTMLDNALTVARDNKIEVWYFGAGPGFTQGFLGTAVGYGYNPEPFSSTDLTTKDFTNAGVQAPQMAVLRRFSGSTQPQPVAYALVRPLLVTSSGNPELPNIAPINYFTPSVASAPFQIYYGGEIPAPVTITPHATLMDGTAAGGMFTPATITLAAGENALVAFTYTPSQAATIQISTTNNVGWINPPALGISTQTDNYADVPANQLGPIYGAYNRYTPNIGPAYRIQRVSDGAQEDVYFTKLGSTGYLGLDRIAIQNWASAQAGITVLRQYDQSPRKSNINFNQGSAFFGSITGTTLTVAALSSGGVAVGQSIVDDALKVAPGTTIVSGSGTTWTVSISQNVPNEAMFTISTTGVVLSTLDLSNTTDYPDIVIPSANGVGISHPQFNGPFPRASQMSVVARFNQTGSSTAGLFNTAHFVGPVAWSNSNIQFSRTGFVGQPPNLTGSTLLATVNLNITNGSYGDYAWVYNVNSGTGHTTYKNGSTTATTSSVLSSFTGTGSGTSLVASSVTGSIQPTDTIYGTCAPAGTYIVSQNAGGTPGGAGTYVTSQPTTCAGDALTTSYVMYPGFDDGTTQLGWFSFAATFWNATYTNFEFATAAYSSAKVAAIMATDATYYSTPLPDPLPGIPPTLTNVVTAAQPTFPGRYPSYPFSTIVISDANAGTPTESVTITLSGAAGTLSGSGISGTGPYTIASGTPTAVSLILQGALFTPGTSTPGDMTTLTTVVTSSAGSSTTVTPSTVITTYVTETPFSAPVGTFTGVNFSGVNLSGGETVNSGAPVGIFPQPFEIDYPQAKGFGLIRLPFTSGGFSGATPGIINSNFGKLNTAFISQIKTVLDYAFTKNMYVVLDVHDYGGVRYQGLTALNTTSGAPIAPNTTAQYLFVDEWARLATLFKNYPNAIFGLMNEPSRSFLTGGGVTAAQWVTCVSTAVTAIRATGATQLITLPGIAFAHGIDWVTDGSAAAYTGFSADPLNNFVFEAHQYLDGGQTGGTPVATINGATALVAMTNWLTANSYQAFLGEFGMGWPDPWYPITVGSNENYDATQSTPQTTNSVTQNSAMLNQMKTSGRWIGWSAWSAGAFNVPLNNGGYIFPLQPTNTGTVFTGPDQPQLPTLQSFIIP